MAEEYAHTGLGRIDHFLAAHRPPTPCIIIDLDMVRAKYRALQALLPQASIFYAVKANPAPEIIAALGKLGAHFDLASEGEMRRCHELGIPAAQLSFGNTIKREKEIADAYAAGVDLFAFDSIGELEKLARAAPGAGVFCRLMVPGKGAEWPLSRKFGCAAEMAIDLLPRAKALGLRPLGVSFHVGSQQTEPQRWSDAIATAARIFHACVKAGLELELLNVGGGFPAQYRTEVPPLAAYAMAIGDALTKYFGGAAPRLLVEPGRYLVGDAGLLRSTVLLVSRKSHDTQRRWVYLDAGRYNGLPETWDERIHYRIRTPHEGAAAEHAILAGPTCDSMDVIYERADYRLPLDLAIGDAVDFLSAGAYTASYASVEFNGFAPIRTYCLSEPRPSPSRPAAAGRKRVVILGAAGRDFHNFNTVYRGDPGCELVAFTAAQIPGIVGRHYPPELAGALYPDGIPIIDERELDALCRERHIDDVVFAYSDVTHEQVMHLASRALATGADFTLLGPRRTMLAASVPVIAITAVRTGCGKSAVARWLSVRLRQGGRRVAVLRHPMPYGDLLQERVQRFATLADLDAANCTVEEREEYEPHIAAGNLVFAGVDYAAILAAAEREADIIVWDGGNNDFPFIRPDLHIVIADALRPRQIATHHPGETVARMADLFVVNKVDAASPEAVETAIEGLRAVNPTAPILRAASPVRLDDAAAVKGRRVLVVEDGPTLTHGGMAYGAGYVAAQAAGAAEIVDPRLSATPEIQEVFRTYPHIGPVLPAVGYGAEQLRALAATINASAAELVVSATPVDLARLCPIEKRIIRARYEYAEIGGMRLSAFVDGFLHARAPLGRSA